MRVLLFVDREEVDVEYFTEIHDGAAVERGDASAGVRVPTVAADGTVGTSFLVFVDDYLSIARDRDRVLDRLIGELPLLGHNDRMAVVAFNGKRLQMVSHWSSSTSALARALAEAKERPTFGLQREARLDLSGAETRDLEKEYLALRVEDDVERVTLAATTALRSFAQAPGRRAMLLLAGGWPYNPRDMVDSTFGNAENFFQKDLGYGPYLYRSLYDTANRLSYTLYPVDVQGSKARGVSAEVRTVDDAGSASRLLSGRDISENALLRLLASETGGRAMTNQLRNSALARAIDDTRSYYWLGFTPDWRGVDERHKVEVRARDKSLKVRSRRSFSDLSRQTEVTMMVESALLFGNPPGPRPLIVKIAPAEPSRRRTVEVPITLLVPLGDLTFLPQSNGWTSEVELRVALQDKDGDRNEIPVIPIQFNFDRTPPTEGYGSYETRLQMRRKKHDAVVSIYDKASGTMLWTHLIIDPE